MENGQPAVPASVDTPAVKPGAPSYAAVLKNEKKPEHDSKRAPGSKLTTVDPPPELELRGISVPGRPSILSIVTGANSQSRVANRVSLLINTLCVSPYDSSIA
jgi:hypothetical protein